MADEGYAKQIELDFTKKSVEDLCPIALKLATILCGTGAAVQLDQHTTVAIPTEVIERTKINAGNPGTIEEIMEYLRIDPWASNWAEGLCEVVVGKDSPEFDACVERLLRKLAERIKEEKGIGKEE